MSVQFEDHTDEVISAKDAAIQKALEMIGLQAENYAVQELQKKVYSQPESPSYKRTGRLLGSITHEVSGKYAVVGTNVEYAIYVEYGTSKMTARPYIKPAATDHMSEYSDIVKSCLQSA